MTDLDRTEVRGPDPIGALEERSLQRMSEARKRPYFDAGADAVQRRTYYAAIDLEADPATLLGQLTQLVSSSHQHFLDYSPSEQLYPWVDLHPDGHLRNIYSGIRVDPEATIRDDTRIARVRADRLTAAMRSRAPMGPGELKMAAREVETEHPFNCEHVVPQGWFAHREPMKGDLHHLFTCETSCNNKRGSIPYAELTDLKTLITGCGRTRGTSGFEPFAGKGPVARATMYFLLRYPGLIGDREIELQRGALPTLVAWHEAEPVVLYEQHRNAAIFEVQGNRNPFIDFSDLTGRLDLSVDFGTFVPADRPTGAPGLSQ